jgi:hypothetical protein
VLVVGCWLLAGGCWRLLLVLVVVVVCCLLFVVGCCWLLLLLVVVVGCCWLLVVAAFRFAPHALRTAPAAVRSSLLIPCDGVGVGRLRLVGGGWSATKPKKPKAKKRRVSDMGTLAHFELFDPPRFPRWVCVR